ncbi:hypothetical protein WR11_15925 [Escherichia coli]|nr:hypothetical protein WR11_15925 [Escherichia coli]
MLFAFLHGGEYSDFGKSIFFPCAVTCFIRDAIFAGHCEFPACGRTVFVNRAICVFTGGAGQSDTSGIFLMGAAHTAMKRRYLLSETDRDVSASIIGFSPVKRDAEKCTTGTTRHAWIGIVHKFTTQVLVMLRDNRQYFIRKKNSKMVKNDPKKAWNILLKFHVIY